MALQEIKKIDLKSASGEASKAVSSDALSVSIIPEFGHSTFEESKNKIGIYIESLTNGPEKFPRSYIFDRAVEINKTIQPQLLVDDIIDLYNEIVIYGHSFTKILETGKVEPTLSFGELMVQSFPKARYTLEPFFESGTVNMVSAPPNTWKSWLLFLISSHIAQGTELFEKFPTEQAKVMIVNEEDSFRAIQDRFKILGVTDTTLPIFFRVANGSKLESKFIDALLAEMKEKEIKVVIFDSLRSMHEADENDSTAMQKILDQMKRLSREGITVIFTHHHRKKGMFEKGSSAESSRGSSAINAAIAGHVSLDEEERDTGLYLVIRHLKSKAGEKLPPFEVKIMTGEGKVEFVYEGEFKQKEKKLSQTKDQVMEVLSDNKWHCKLDFTEKINVGKNNLIQALTVLKNDGMIVSLTRKQAVAKSIPVRNKGHVGELYYSLNTESAEAMTMVDEIVTQNNWDEITND